MADSTAVFPPGFRVTDSTTGAALSGAVIRFYDAGTTTPKIVYADSELTTALGTSVVCDTLGYPTSNGTTKTQIYVGTAAYKVRIETSTAAEIVTHDNVKGAVVADAGGSLTVSASRPVVVKALDYTIVDADKGTVFVTNCSSADVTYTLPSAVTVGNGWSATVQHAGSANQVFLATVSSQTISEGSKNFAAQYVLSVNGEDVTIVADGGNWRIIEHTAPFMKNATGIIPIISRVATSPGSPGQGAMHIVTGLGGAFSTAAVNDIALYTGASWVFFTPSTNCGWKVYVQSEGLGYQFIASAWEADTATTSRAGIVQLADAAAMEARTASRGVTADLQHRHPGHPKCWAYVSVAAGVPTLQTSYNVASITDTGVGQLTVTLTTAFTNSNWAALLSKEGSDGAGEMYVTTRTASSIVLNNSTSGVGSDDPTSWAFVGYGDQT